MSNVNRKIVNLSDEDDMRTRLEAVLPEDLAAFIPHLLHELAGKQLVARGVLLALVYAVEDYRKEVSPLRWSVFVEKDIYFRMIKPIIEAIVDDEDVKVAVLLRYNEFLQKLD